MVFGSAFLIEYRAYHARAIISLSPRGRVWSGELATCEPQLRNGCPRQRAARPASVGESGTAGNRATAQKFADRHSTRLYRQKRAARHTSAGFFDLSCRTLTVIYPVLILVLLRTYPWSVPCCLRYLTKLTYVVEFMHALDVALAHAARHADTKEHP